MTAFGRLMSGARTGTSPALAKWALLGALVLVGWIAGEFVVDMPKKTLAGVGVLSTLVVALSLPKLFPWLFIRALALLLIGYAFFGRAFAHLGVAPLFVGEAVLAIGLVAMLTTPQRWVGLRSPVTRFYLLFAGWSAIRAIQDLPVYGLDTLRDSVIWGYGTFAILLPAFLIRSDWVPRLLQRYSRWFPVLLVWLPIGLVFSYLFPHLLPVAYDSEGGTMELVKPGDAGIHLAGAAAFLLLGLHRAPGVRPRAGLLGNGWILGGACIAAFFALSVLGRGGAMAALVAIFAVLIIRPIPAFPKLALVGAGAVVATLLLIASNFTLEMGRRDLSAQQLSSNLLSVIGQADEGQANLEQTKNWRLRWWTAIVDYTVHGPYFWTGKGFGVNLAIDDGIRKETFNRHPHSAHMSILARAGVPGLVLWVLLQAVFGASLLAAFLRATRMGQEWWARLDLWVLAYWLAFLTASSFGVYLEGPHGGIWFWCVMGLGISVLLTQRQALEAPARAASRPGHAPQAATRS
jgi:hypothetical protein